MLLSDLLHLTPYPGLSLLILFACVSAVFYFARDSLRAGLLRLARTLYQVCRAGSLALRQAEAAVRRRNREILLEQGKQQAQRGVEREFERIDLALRRELGDYQALHRQVEEAIADIEADYQRSRELPPSPFGWSAAVDAVANIKAPEGVVATMLESIHHSVEAMEERALEAYRRESRERHKLLNRSRPRWQELIRRLKATEVRLERLLDRAATIDAHMASFAAARERSDASLRKLFSSSLNRFLVSGLLLLAVAGGAALNYQLIVLPMGEMLGRAGMIGSLMVADVAAVVIVLLGMSMGVLISESLRMTRLFPALAELDDMLRTRLVWAALAILTALALVGAGLAFMREILILEELAGRAMLRGELIVTPSSLARITTLAQMGLGFILPFALVFCGIPLEGFVLSLRTVLGWVAAMLLRAGAGGLRLLGIFLKGLGPVLADFCDALAFLPLWIESRLGRDAGLPGRRGRLRGHAPSSSGPAPL